MKSPCCAAIVLVLLGFTPVIVQAQPRKKEDPRRFWAVKTWNGTFTVTRRGPATKPTARMREPITMARSTGRPAAQFHLANRQEKDEFQQQPVHWSGTGHGHLSVEFYRIEGDHRQWLNDVTRGSGESTLRQTKLPKFPVGALTNWEDGPLGPELAIQRVSATEGHYRLNLGVMVLNVQERSTLLHLDPDDSRFNRADSVSRPAMFIIQLSNLSLPQEGLVLKGSKTVAPYSIGNDVCHLERDASHHVQRSFINGHVLGKPNDDPPCVVSWELTPAAEDARLVIGPEDQEKYDAWLPHAGKDEKTPGNDVAFVARLETPGGKPAPAKARKIRFELVDVSRKPGIAINFPIRTRATDDFDLRFTRRRTRAT